MTVDLNAIKAANQAAGARWTASETSMTRLPDDASRRLRLGYVPAGGEPSLQERAQRSQAGYPAHIASLGAGGAAHPTKFDWRDVAALSYISQIKDQGACGSCVAFGTAATIDATIRITLGIPVNSWNSGPLQDVSEAQLFYCGAGQMCESGWYVTEALNYCTSAGLTPEIYYPYTSVDQACQLPGVTQMTLTRLADKQGWHEIDTIDDMKSWIATRGPLITCFIVNTDFYSYSGGIYTYQSGSYEGGHCVSCIGYDDSRQAWLCKNSWGTYWGESGFFWIGYGQCGIDDAMWAIDDFATIYSGVPAANTAIGSCAVANSNPRVYYLDGAAHIRELAWTNGWYDRDVTVDAHATAAAGSSVSACAVNNSDPRVYHLDAASHVHELAWFGNQWHTRDLTADTATPSAAAGSSISSCAVSNNAPRVYYLDASCHVHELAWTNAWAGRDLTAEAKAPVTAAGRPITSCLSRGTDPRVYYLDAASHIHELAWFGNQWHVRDLTADTATPSAAPDSTITSCIVGDTDPRVYYLDSAYHVRELAWFSGQWHGRDLTADTNTSGSSKGGAVSCCAVNGSAPRVYYQDNILGHVHELAWTNSWHDGDLSAQAQAPSAVLHSAISSCILMGTDPRVYYLDSSGHARELAWFNNQWHDRDLTVTG